MNKLPNGSKHPFRTLTLGAIMVACLVPVLHTQETQSPQVKMPDWQVAAGGHMEFDVASVKENKSVPLPNGDRPNSNFFMDAGDGGYTPGEGLLRVVRFALSGYISFAYKLTQYQSVQFLSQLPKWAATNRYDIQARSDAKPTKDQMRLMVQSLLEDRFKLAAHFETRQLPEFALVLDKPGKTGPQLQPHSEDPPCDPLSPDRGSAPPAPTMVSGKLLGPCGVFGGHLSGDQWNMGGRNLTMTQLANYLAFGGIDRFVVDETGLTGTFDLSFQFIRDPALPPYNFPSGRTAGSEQNGLTLLEALQEQLGLKLKSQTGPVEVLVIDRVEKPSEN